MMEAALHNYADLVSELLARGAGEDLTDRWEDTALQTAEQSSSYDVIKMFSAWQHPESRNDKLLEAASEGKSRFVRGLLKSGASLEHRDAGDEQALHLAAKKGHNAVISVLLDHGANINSRGTNDDTALMTAAQADHHNTVRLILEAGADMDLKDDDGKTALMGATLANNLKVASELVNWGADTTITDEDGDTPLEAAWDNILNEIALVLDDTEISEDDPHIKKVLLTATESGHITVLSHLFKRGARLFEVKQKRFIKNEVGNTLLHNKISPVKETRV